jgi:cytochrome P450
VATSTTVEPAPDREAAQAAAPPSPAGPVEEERALRMPPAVHRSRLVQTITFGARPLSFMLRPARRFGDVWQLELLSRDEPMVVTCHPDHVESLFRAKPQDAPSLTGESPLRPILGPNSVLTMVGERHMRERKLLLPPFHGDAVKRYVQLISEVIEREIATWPVAEPFSLAPRMQAVTLDVIMAGVFGIEGKPAPGTVEHRIRQTIRRLLRASTNILFELVELQQLSQPEPRGPMKWMLSMVDRELYAAIRQRRAAPVDPGAHDIFSILLQARDEQGNELSDEELRDQLVSLVLAGHETTANSLAWTFERLLRSPAAYGRLRELVRSDDEAAETYVEATIHEGMRVRPVIPFVVRLIKQPWELGEYVVPADTPVAVSIVALHHREDVYPDPHVFRPERFVDHKPGTYTWIPFGGGIRRCLGASLAMAEQRVVLREIVKRVDLRAPRAGPERTRQRNVTMIPARGGRVIVERKL